VAVRQLKSGTAAGSDGLIPEVYKWGGTNIISLLEICFRNIWNGEEEFPPSWREARVVILFKGKGSRKDPNNYRGIFLLDVGGKVFARFIANRITPIIEASLDELAIWIPDRQRNATSYQHLEKATGRSKIQKYPHFCNLYRSGESIRQRPPGSLSEAV